ncbi:MAG TPA: pyridoxamine 5'-phosphate oxidase [Solirubrobacterales bacterium]|nr:pyridoxamine 5'-phosphate oxidase [Solirubrobacterales bacterium]
MSEPTRHTHPLLRRADLADDPIEQFDRWYRLAAAEVPLPEAMTLATVDSEGAPDARMVLLKGHGPEGFRFFTNYESAKAAQIAADPRGALVVYWRELDRQVRVRGSLERLPAQDSDAYFATRLRESRLGAWASPQSQPLPGRDDLERRLAEVEAEWEGEEEIPRPGHWGGFLLRPETVEFWQGQRARLHDRFLYRREPEGGWRLERLAP